MFNPDTVRIDENVPLTPAAFSEFSQSLYTVTERLNVGDSFLISFDDASTGSVHGRLVRLNGSSNKRFVARRTPDGTRVWRTN